MPLKIKCKMKAERGMVMVKGNGVGVGGVKQCKFTKGLKFLQNCTEINDYFIVIKY